MIVDRDNGALRRRGVESCQPAGIWKGAHAVALVLSVGDTVAIADTKRLAEAGIILRGHASLEPDP
jgi:hypothetical protein